MNLGTDPGNVKGCLAGDGGCGCAGGAMGAGCGCRGRSIVCINLSCPQLVVTQILCCLPCKVAGNPCSNRPTSQSSTL